MMKYKFPVGKKEAAWKEVLAASNEEAKEKCMGSYREEKKKVKRFIYPSKKNVWMINHDIIGNKKLFLEGSE